MNWWHEGTSSGGLLFTAQQLYHCRFYQGGEHSATLSKRHLGWDALSYSPRHNAWRGCWHCSAPAIRHEAAHAPRGAGVSEHQRGAEKGRGGGGTHSFIVDPWLTPRDSIKTCSWRDWLGGKVAPLGEGDSEPYYSECRLKWKRRRWVWMGMKGLTWYGALWKWYLVYMEVWGGWGEGVGGHKHINTRTYSHIHAFLVIRVFLSRADYQTPANKIIQFTSNCEIFTLQRVSRAHTSLGVHRIIKRNYLIARL